MRKLEGAALKKTMAELKKGKNGELLTVKGKSSPAKKSGILRKVKKSPPSKAAEDGEHLSLNGKAESDHLLSSPASMKYTCMKDEGNGGVKFMEDETDPYCPDFDDEPALLPLIGRKRKPVMNNFDNGVTLDTGPRGETVSMNGDMKENVLKQMNTASTSDVPGGQLPNGSEYNDLNGSTKKTKKNKLKATQNESHENYGGATKVKKKRKESIESSADNLEHSPPKKKKKEKTVVKCETCSKTFSSEKLYTRHLKICNLNEEELNRLQPHKCSECDYRSPKKAMVTRHLESHGIFKCVKCNFVGESKEAFREHTLEAHKDRADMKLCRVCSRYVKCDTITLEQHMSECKGKVPLYCPECKKEFKYESSLNVHLNSHYPDRPKRFSCQQCDYKSNYKANLQKHITCMHENRVRSVKCDICTKLFYSEEAMKRHVKLHADDRPYICSVCGHACRSPSAYKSHQETHKPNNSFFCTINDCADGFRTASLLKKHEQTFHHVVQKHFHCREKGCKLSFFKRSHLRRHETTHTGERKYRCEWEGCGKAFRHADNLKVHMRQHTNENPVKCELCSFTCKQKSSLKWHMGKRHPEDDKKKKVVMDTPQDDWAFWEAVMAVIGPDGTGLDEGTIGQTPVALKESKTSGKKKGSNENSKKKKSSGQGKKKVSKGKADSSSKSDKASGKKKRKSIAGEKGDDDAENVDAVKPENVEDNSTEDKTSPKGKKKKGAKGKSSKTTGKSKGKKTNKSKDKAEVATKDVQDEQESAGVKTPKKRQRKAPLVKGSPEEGEDCDVDQDAVDSVSVKVSPLKGKKVAKGKKLSKSKACKVAKRKGKTAGRAHGKKRQLKGAKKSPKASSSKLKDSAAVKDEAVEEIVEEEKTVEETVSRKRKRGRPVDTTDPVTVKAKKAKKTPTKTGGKGKKASAKPKKKPSKAKQKKTLAKTENDEVIEESGAAVEEEPPKEPQDDVPSNDISEEINKESEKAAATEEQPPEELDSDSDLWGNNDDNNTEEPDRNCDADDERDLDNDDDVDKLSEAGFLGDIDKPLGGALEKRSVDDDARSHVSDANNSVSDVASLDDAIPDTPPRAPMRPNDNEEEVDENDYYQPPPSPPRTLDSVDQRSVERQDSEQTVIDNSLPHSNNTCTPQDVLSEEAVVKDSMQQPDTTPTYVHTPQSQQPEAPPPPHPTEKDYFGQYLQDLPTVEGQAAPPAPTQESSPGQVPEDLTNIQIPSGNVEGTSDEIKALDLRPEPVSTITHTRLQRETVTGLATSNIERETVSTITHTSRTVQPLVTQPSCIPVPGMQTDVMSYQRMELLACGRPDNFMQQKESSLQRLTSITYQNFGSLDTVNPTCRDMNYLRPTENMFPRSCAGGSFMRVTDGESSLGRAGMNSFLRQPDTSFVRPETSLTRAANPSLLRPGTEDLFARDAMGRPVSRSPFHGAWTGQEIRPAHWNQNPYLQRPVDRTTNSATPALLGTERDFTFDPSRSIPDQNVFSNLTSQQHELPRDTPFQLERFDLSSYFGTHPYSATPALEYGHATCGANQKAFEDRLRQPSAVPDLRGLPQPPSTDMLNQFCGINVNPSFNLDKYMYARDPVYRPQHVTGTSESAFLSHTAPTQPTYFSRDYTGRTLYPQSNPYALMDDRQYGTASKLTHPAGVQQDRDLMGRRSTTNDNQIQDPYRRSVIYNVMNRF